MKTARIAMLFAAAAGLLTLCSCSKDDGSITRAEPSGAVAQTPVEKWTLLFNGKDLTGWAPIGNARWTVEDGMLVGQQGDKNAPGDLLTTADYADFELTCTYKVVWPANTGIWFRYQSAKQAYQADILEWKKPVCWSGTLYCPGKMFLACNTDASLVNREGWNTMKVRAQGDHLQIWLNGRQTADVHDTSSATGKFGFQVHPGAEFGPMKMIVREIKLRPLANETAAK